MKIRKSDKDFLEILPAVSEKRWTSYVAPYFSFVMRKKKLKSVSKKLSTFATWYLWILKMGASWRDLSVDLSSGVFS